VSFTDYTRSEIQWFIDECNFTDEESSLFLSRTQGKTLAAVSAEMNISVSTANRLTVKIKRKIEKATKEYYK